MSPMRVGPLTVLCLASLAASAYGAFSVRAQFGVGGTNHFSPDEAIGDTSESTTATTATVGGSNSITNPALPQQDTLVEGNATATAGIGHLHGVAGFSVFGRTFVGSINGNDTLFSGTGSGSASAEATWTDTAIFQSTGEPDGASVTINASLNFHGSVNGGGSAFPDLQISVDPQSPDNPNHVGSDFARGFGGASALISGNGIFGGAVSSFSSGSSDGSRSDSLPIPKSIPVTLQAIVGGSISVRYDLQVGAAGGGMSGSLVGDEFSGVGTADVGETVGWGGISSVIDNATGQPITNWTIKSDSGFDYSKPFVETPEPASLILLSMGGVLLFAKAMDGHRRAQASPSTHLPGTQSLVSTPSAADLGLTALRTTTRDVASG
jgi:hypothetical protein